MKRRLISVSLALVMLLSLLPMAVLAEDGSGTTAQVGTAEELAKALENGGTVQLTDDITWEPTATVQINNQVVLDLNGYDLVVNTPNNSNARCSFQIGTLSDDSPSLTIKDSAARGGGTLTVNSMYDQQGRWNPLAAYLIKVYGTFDILGGSITMNANASTDSYGVDVDGGAFRMSGGVLTGGTKIGSTYTLYAPYSGTKEITGGLLDGGYDAGSSPSDWNISGGYFTVEPTYTILPDGKAAQLVTAGEYEGKYMIVDGTICGLVDTTAYTDLKAFAEAIGGKKITVEDTTLTLTDNVTLAPTEGNKITILSNLTIDLAGHTLAGAMADCYAPNLIYIDKAGQTLTIKDSGEPKGEERYMSVSSSDAAIRVNQGSLVLDGAKIAVEKTETYSSATAIDLYKSGTSLSMKNGAAIDVTSTGAGTDVKPINAKSGTTVSIEGSDNARCAITASGLTDTYGIYSSGADVTVKNCNITVGGTGTGTYADIDGIYQYDGSLDVQDNVSIVYNGSDAGNAYGIYSYIGSGSAGISGSDVSIKIGGQNAAKRAGIYSSKNFVISPGTGVSIAVDTDNAANGTNSIYDLDCTSMLEIAGGTYSGGDLKNISATGGVYDRDPSDICAIGYVAQADALSEGKWTVVADTTEHICNVTQGKNYVSITDALEEAKPNDELQLLTDIRSANTTVALKDLTLDLNGYTLLLKQIDLSGSVTITDEQATSYADAGTLSAVLVEGEGGTTLTKINYSLTDTTQTTFIRAGQNKTTYTSVIRLYGVKGTVSYAASTGNIYAICTYGTGEIDLKGISGFDNSFVVQANSTWSAILFNLSNISSSGAIDVTDGVYTLENNGNAHLIGAGSLSDTQSVNIMGGYFKTKAPSGSSSLLSSAADKNKINITGGYFAGYVGDASVDSSTYFANASKLTGGQYSPIALDTGTESYSDGYRYEVKSVPVCQIDGASYNSVQEAIDKADAGDTIKLLIDCQAYELVLDKNVTFEGDYKITPSGAKPLTLAADVDLPSCINLSGCGAYILHKSGEKTYCKTFYAQSYDDPENAVTYYDAETDDKIVLMKNFASGYMIVYKDCTIDLNGNTISSTSQPNGDPTLEVYQGTVTVMDSSIGQTGKITGTHSGVPTVGFYDNGGTFILKSGTVENTNDGPAIAVTNSYNNVITINGGKVTTGNNIAILDQGAYSGNIDININGGLVESSGSAAIYKPASGTLTLNGGTVRGSTGIYVRCGKVVIPTDSTVKVFATGDPVPDSDKTGGANLTGDALVITVSNYPGGNPTADIAGGYFKSDNNDAVAAYAITGQTAISKFISGGYYSDVPDSAYLADGWVVLKNENDETNEDYPYLVSKALTYMTDYAYGATPSTPSSSPVVNESGNECAVEYYYSTATFLGGDNESTKWENIDGTTLRPGSYFIKAVYYKNGDVFAEAKQTTFKVTKGTQEQPTALVADGSIMTVAAADRNVANRSLEYQVNGGGWRDVPALTENGTFTVDGLSAGANTVSLRWKENSYYEVSSAVSTSAEMGTTYSVRYTLNGGTGTTPASQTATTPGTITVAGSSGFGRVGYTFAGWNTASDGSGTNYAPNSTIDNGGTLYAQWTANSYTVRFNANGGTGTMDNQTFTYDTAQTLTAKGFTKDGYTFAGWSASANGSVAYLDGQNVKNLAESGKVTLYAVWTQNTGDVTGTIKTDSDANIKVELKLGASVIKTADVSPDSGSADYSFSTVPCGTYNLVITQGSTVVTQKVVIGDGTVLLDEITMPNSGVNSVLVIEGEDTQPVVVGNLDKEAESKAEENKKVFLVMTVKKQEEQELPDNADTEQKDTQTAIDAISAKAEEVTRLITDNEMAVEYLNINVDKYVGDETLTLATIGPETFAERLVTTNNVIEIVVPYDMSGKENIKVYRHHNEMATDFTLLAARPTGSFEDETYCLDTANDLIYVYARKFSTYGISYTVAAPAPSPAPAYSVTVEDSRNGSVTASGKSAAKGSTVTITVKPDEGYALKTLTVLDKDGNALGLTSKGGGKYTFTMPGGEVTVTAAFTDEDGWNRSYTDCPKDETCPIEPFPDAVNKEWYHDGVHFCIENGLMVGFPDGNFYPYGDVTRAQVVTILWRLEDSPVVNYAMQFEDAPADAWFTEAVRWAASNGVVTGYSDKAFGPNDAITREQFAAILWRYSKLKGYDVSVGEDTNILNYNDAQSVSSYAVPAIQWACGSGMISGTSALTLDPTGVTSRAQAATMFMRYCAEIVK